MTLSRIGKKLSAEHCRNISIGNKGKRLSESVVQGLRKRMVGNTFSLGVKRSPETISKMRKPKSEQHIASFKLAYSEGRHAKPSVSGKDNPFYGRQHSEETKTKLRNRIVRDDSKALMSAWQKGRTLTEQHKRNIAAGLARRRAKMVEQAG